MTIELAAATGAGIGTGPAPIINSGSSGRIESRGSIPLGGEMLMLWNAVEIVLEGTHSAQKISKL